MPTWENYTKIKMKQVGGKIPVYLPKYHAQCPICHHCFIMIEKGHFKYCPECGSEMKKEGK